ncbi:hypothetical protein MKW98_007111, partial [Papaver atlanticum]
MNNTIKTIDTSIPSAEKEIFQIWNKKSHRFHLDIIDFEPRLYLFKLVFLEFTHYSKWCCCCCNFAAVRS